MCLCFCFCFGCEYHFPYQIQYCIYFPSPRSCQNASAGKRIEYRAGDRQSSLSCRLTGMMMVLSFVLDSRNFAFFSFRSRCQHSLVFRIHRFVKDQRTRILVYGLCKLHDFHPIYPSTLSFLTLTAYILSDISYYLPNANNLVCGSREECATFEWSATCEFVCDEQ